MTAEVKITKREIILNKFIIIVNFILGLFGEVRKDLSKIYLSDGFVPVKKVGTKYGEIDFYAPGDLLLIRARTFHYKEPKTLAWIDNFEKDDVLFDIGANIGVYSLYAGLKGHRVYAFEPSSFNFSILNRNIHLNGLQNLISGLCLAFSNEDRVDYLNMLSIKMGGAGSCFYQNIGPDWKEFSPYFRQGAVGLRLETFLDLFANVEFPTHIKIDVDGIECEILQGAGKCLADKRLKSILVEIDASNKKAKSQIYSILNENGFVLTEIDQNLNHIFIR